MSYKAEDFCIVNWKGWVYDFKFIHLSDVSVDVISIVLWKKKNAALESAGFIIKLSAYYSVRKKYVCYLVLLSVPSSVVRLWNYILPFKLYRLITVYSSKYVQCLYEFIFSDMKNAIPSTAISRPKYISVCYSRLRITRHWRYKRMNKHNENVCLPFFKAYEHVCQGLWVTYSLVFAGYSISADIF